MRRVNFLLIFTLIVTVSSAQSFHIGVFGGLSAYNGDLTDKIFPKKITNGVIGITGNYEFNEKIMIRAGLNYSIVGGADRFSDDPSLVIRNLSFETRIYEFSLVGEYDVLNLYDRRYTPYAFAGLAIFRFNPYAFTPSRQKVYLKPLSTEGQGLPGYPERKEYSLTQMAIPFGGGLKFAITDNLRIAAEFGLRKLFTDYLDDISTNFADQNDLLAARGQLAVDMSYRGDEIGGDPNYPAKGAQRGSPKHKDYYYFTGLHLTYRLGGSGDGLFGGGNKSRTGCPVNVY